MQPRIAMVLPYYHPQYGGAENQARLLARHLVDKHGLAVLVLTLHLFGGPRKETLDGHTVLRFGKPSASDSIAEGFQEILAWLESNTDSYDIVHQHFIFGQMPERQLDVARLCARIDKPCIMKVTSSEKITSLCRSVPDAKSALSLYRAIVAINSEIATELDVAGVSASRVAAIPNGVDTSFYRPPSPSERLASRKASDLKEQEFSALFVGRLVAKKDLGTFLRACSMLRESPRTLRAAVVGGDANDQAKRQPDNVPAQDSLRAYAKELRIACDWVGDVLDPASVRTHYWAADCLVQPSINEGCSNALLEAMACGLPSVSSNIQANVDLVQGTGNPTFQVRDAVDLCERLRAMMDSPFELERLGRSSRAEATSQYGMPQVASRYLDLYLSLGHRS